MRLSRKKQLSKQFHEATRFDELSESHKFSILNSLTEIKDGAIFFLSLAPEKEGSPRRNYYIMPASLAESLQFTSSETSILISSSFKDGINRTLKEIDQTKEPYIISKKQIPMAAIIAEEKMIALLGKEYKQPSIQAKDDEDAISKLHPEIVQKIKSLIETASKHNTRAFLTKNSDGNPQLTFFIHEVK